MIETKDPDAPCTRFPCPESGVVNCADTNQGWI